MNYETRARVPETLDAYVEQLPENIIRALKIMMEMDDSDRGELQRVLETFNSLPDEGRTQLREIVINVHTGPLTTKCPYCGRG